MTSNNQSLPPLPELPEERARFTSTEGQHRALKMFVREYGDARAAHARTAALDLVLNCYSPDDTVTDYQDKIKELLK